MGELIPRDESPIQQLHPIVHDYEKGKLHDAAAVASNTTVSEDLETAGYDLLRVVVELAATTTTGDLTVTVKPYAADGTTLSGAPLETQGASSVTSDGTNVWITQLYRLGGVDKVSVGVKNANASSKNATASYFLQR